MRQGTNSLKFLEAMIRYLMEAAESLTADDLRDVLENAAPEGVVFMGTIAQEWRMRGEQEGFEKGLQQGHQQGEQRGLRQGLLDGIQLALELRFGLDGLRLLPEIAKLEDVGVLKAVHEGLRRAETPEALRQLYRTLV